MGYCISQTDAKFRIAAERINDARKALYKELTIEDHRWIDTHSIKKSWSFEKLMNECRYDVTFDDNGNVVDFTFEGEKAGDDVEILDAIAPFVDAGSYIEMGGEDGSEFRWVFDGTTCTKKFMPKSLYCEWCGTLTTKPPLPYNYLTPDELVCNKVLDNSGHGERPHPDRCGGPIKEVRVTFTMESV